MFSKASLLSASLSILTVSALTTLQGRETVVCETVHTGTVRLFSLDQSQAPLPTTGANVSLYYDSEASAFLIEGNAGRETQFEFQQCNSSYTGYTQTSSISYGTLVPVGQEACMAAALGASSGPPYLLLNNQCTFWGGDYDLTLYWAFNHEDMALNFLGVTSTGGTYNDDGYTTYTTVLNAYDGQQAIEVAAYAGEPPAELLRLAFID
ncbi:hypothetical protein BV22DRAFT_1133491 [Leucogyrophana mollusca]|uniref:Uncharacterized protein n=1 Tax=Leucogyrophana mollusca TaxID=85980 RepID=A0ACB8B2Z5_9AGAM|nr:hypothetical protein BV22DRAFT_1133491 [Leucogyrophana mollusca]